MAKAFSVDILTLDAKISEKGCGKLYKTYRIGGNNGIALCEEVHLSVSDKCFDSDDINTMAVLGRVVLY